jgi:hypothetical protein
MSEAQQLTFSHSCVKYTFRGRKLPIPDPSTYDASRWTPPTHELFSVTVQSDGLWVLQIGNVDMQSGEFGKATRKWAKEIVLKYLARRGL